MLAFSKLRYTSVPGNCFHVCMFVNGADTDEMPPSGTFNLGLHCLSFNVPI